MQRPLLAAIAVLVSSSLVRAQLPDFDSSVPFTEWSTDSTQVVPVSGPPYTVTGGVFVFNQVRIRAGHVLRGTGSRPMLILCNQLLVEGELTVSGLPGETVTTIGGANFPALGGRGGPAGGDGGAGSPQMGLQSMQAQSGNGPGNTAGLGGGE